MNCICTFFLEGKPFGSIVTFSDESEAMDGSSKKQLRVSSKNGIYIFIEPKAYSPGKTATVLDIKLSKSELVDEGLKDLSSNEYVILMKNTIYAKGKIYSINHAIIPVQCQYKALPFIYKDTILNVKSTRKDDIVFFREGYAKEFKDAEYILIPPSWDCITPTCTVLDLLIKEKSEEFGDFISFSGRQVHLEDGKGEGRYIFLSEIPVFSGKITYPVFTYTPQILIQKYRILNERLDKYGATRVDTVCNTLQSLCKILKETKGSFEISSIYNDVVALQDKIKIIISSTPQ